MHNKIIAERGVEGGDWIHDWARLSSLVSIPLLRHHDDTFTTGYGCIARWELLPRLHLECLLRPLVQVPDVLVHALRLIELKYVLAFAHGFEVVELAQVLD